MHHIQTREQQGPRLRRMTLGVGWGDVAFCKAKAAEESGETCVPVHLPGNLTSLSCHLAGFIFGDHLNSTSSLIDSVPRLGIEQEDVGARGHEPTGGLVQGHGTGHPQVPVGHWYP